MTQQPLALQLADSADACQLTVHDCSLVAKELRRLHGLAQRTWVGLTGHEQKALMAMNAREAVFATETKLKEKNT
jgi:hypothetical protein